MKKIIKKIIKIILIIIILYFLIMLVAGFAMLGLGKIMTELSPKESASSKTVYARIGNIYEDNNVTMEPIKSQGLSFYITTIKVHDQNLILKFKFENNNIEKAEFSYFLYNLNNKDDVMLAYSLIDPGLTYPLEDFKKEHNLSKDLPLRLSKNIENYSTFELEKNNDSESIYVATVKNKKEDFDINLLKDGLTFELFELNCTDDSVKTYRNEAKYIIKLEY